MYQPTRAYAKYVLYILLLVYVSNQWSRYLLNYMYSISYDGMTEAEAEKYSITYATDITASEYGLLVGFGFSFMYVLCGLVMGRAADSSSRRNIIFAGLVIWNVAIVIMGMSNNFVQLLISRIILGIGESFSAPASYSLIADYFPVEARAEANGIYAFGVYVGGGLGSLAIAMSDGVGWRTACYIVAVYGFILAALTILTVKEPERTQKKSVEAAPQEAEYTFLESLREIFSSKLVCILFIAGSVRFMGGYAIASFLPTFYSYQFTSYSTLYSYLNASVVAFGGALSSYLGGKFADGWEKAGNRYARVWVPAIGAAAAIPFMVLCVLSSNFYISMGALFFEYLIAECWFGPAISVLQNALPARVRGTGIACFTFITTMVGSGTSYGMGIIYDNIVDDDEEDPTNTIKTELLVAVVASYGIAAYLFYIAASFMEDENEISAEKAGLLSKQSAAASSAVEEEEASNKAEAV
mmetsp:Transcript_23973/g.31123  ORF Transcript_23973/g.31123 Transcript_23973/m.31123 type:complete len:469 (+) Transcript_23973:92-1498(+)